MRKLLTILTVPVALFAASQALAPYDDVEPLLNQGPSELHNADQNAWLAWARKQDQVIRARLQQGDLDSMVNLLLYGTSFTSQPRISMQGEGIVRASKSGVLRARVDDLVAGLRSPGSNQRLQFLDGILRAQGIDASADPRAAGAFILRNLQRVVQERIALARTPAAKQPDHPSPLDRSSLFENRGLSLDTGIVPDFTVEETLRDLKAQGVLRPGQISSVAVIGPGLDFIDKNEASAFDYYPEQTLQPFALYDSLLRLGLAKSGALSLTVLDISPQVIEHIRHARERAAKGSGYAIQLPRDSSRPWPGALTAYWKSFGDRVASPAAPIPPPRALQGLETRAVEVRPSVVLALDAADLDIIVQRLDLPPADRFDLIVATNIFVYYDAFEQSIALENTAAMLKPGGLLLTNDRLPTRAGGSMQLAGVTTVPATNQAMASYRKQ